jgi:hypothetical protein
VRNQFHGRKRTSAALGILLAVAVAGGAFAYWTIGGSGTGSAFADAGDDAIAVVQTTEVAGLYPGGSSVTLGGYYSNPNPGPVWVGTLSVAVDPAWNAGTCAADDFAVNGPLAVNAQIPTGTTNWTGLSIRMRNLAENQDDCKGVTVPLVYTVEP